MRQHAQIHFRTSRARRNALDRIAAEKGCTVRELIEAAIDQTYNVPTMFKPYEYHPGGGDPKITEGITY